MPFLTGDAAALSKVCRRFAIPDNYLSAFMGALYVLTVPENWEQFGTATELQCSEMFESIIDSYIEGCMIGTVFQFLTADPPENSLELNGNTHANADFPDFAASIDPEFDNGDGTFTLPDFRGRALVGAGTGAGLTTRAVGDTFGNETHTLDSSEMPIHSHGYNEPSGVFLALTGEEPSVLVINPAGVTASAGGGGAHNNTQPSLSIRMAVWVR